MKEYYEISRFQLDRFLKSIENSEREIETFNKISAYLVVATFACEVGLKGLIEELNLEYHLLMLI